jgi:hypothetical protein
MKCIKSASELNKEIISIKKKYDGENDLLLVSSRNNLIREKRYSISNDLRIINQTDSSVVDFAGSKVVVVPASINSRKLIHSQKIANFKILNFIDKSKSIQGKLLDGIKISSYEELKNIDYEYILCLPPKQHEEDILMQINENTKIDPKKIIVIE